MYYITLRVSFDLGKWEVTCCLTFLSGGCRGCWRSIELYSKLPMCALIIATFSAFFPLKVILWWEKYKDSSSTLKDDSLSELYSPAQSMSLRCRFSRTIRSVSVSSFFFSLRICIWARCSTYSATSFSGTMYLSENFLIASLSPLTSSFSSSNRLIWARGWKSSGSRPLVGVALQHYNISFPSFYSSYILAHFQVFTIQSHAKQLTACCADERGYMSNTSSLLFSLSFIFVLDR